jgi:hypothetical protein
MVMSCCSPCLVVIDIINVCRAIIEAENHPPVGPDGNGPNPFHPTFERMQPEPRQIHVGNRGSSMKRCQNIPQLGSMFRVDAAGVVLFKKPFQPSMADTLYHPAVTYPATWHMSRATVARLRHEKCAVTEE